MIRTKDSYWTEWVRRLHQPVLEVHTEEGRQSAQLVIRLEDSP